MKTKHWIIRSIRYINANIFCCNFGRVFMHNDETEQLNWPIMRRPGEAKWKIVIDIISIICSFWLLIGSFIFAHYYPSCCDSHGNPTIETKLYLFFALMGGIGVFWLLLRYLTMFMCKYNFTNRPFLKPLIAFGIPCLYLVGYLILKNTLWK